MSYDAYLPSDDDADAELDSLRAQAAHDRKTHSRLLANPDCRDPDHPGCESCADDDDES